MVKRASSEPKSKTMRFSAVKPHDRWRWPKRLAFAALILGLLGAGAATAVILVFASDPDLPNIGNIGEYRPKVISRVMSADGEVIGEIFEERRTVIPIDKIPDVMKHAIVDAEDAGFYTHEGLSYWGMLRAMLHNLKPGAHMQGASTLTQQLVRNLILRSNARTLKRKVQELILARRIEDKLSKHEILWLYLNQIEFPYQRFGIEEAARFYFGKSVTEIDAGEAALLASLPKGPSEIDPWKHPERAKDRQKYVLSQMVRYKHLSEAEAEKFARAPIKLVKTSSPYLGIAPEVVDEVKRVLVERMGAKRLMTAGVTVTTTIDAKLQKAAREALESNLRSLDERQGYRKPLRNLAGKALEAHLKKLEKDWGAVKNPLVPIFEGVVKEVKEDHALVETGRGGASPAILPLPLTGDRYNPTGLPAAKRFRAGDVVRVRYIEIPKDGKSPPTLMLEQGPQSALVVIDPQTRAIKAMVGGYGQRLGSPNRATTAKRQPGSAFKPFVYAAALSTEKFTPASVLIDGPQVYASPGLAPWKPSNAEKEEFLGPVRLRVALAKSLNTVASQLVDVQRDGVDPSVVVAMAKEAGIESELAPNPSLALGTSEVTPIELTNAYATIAAGGKRMAPQLIVKIGDQAEDDPAKTAVQAMKPELAYVITSMMTSVIEEGTAASARGKLKRPAAGKTGTTNSRKDAWFVGFTPDLVCGVWTGYDDMRELGRGEQGARAALPIWVDVMIAAHKGLPPKPFAQPPGVVVQKIDPKTGLLAAPGAAGAIDEVFLEGTAPTQVAPAAGEANPDTYMTEQ
jgi:penicillin-binding protein 1A